ncbi:MAG: DUF2344 domain-containing protein [Planctomycetota bacterium]|nr:MAG: DUF2344 domain-containing protein [Planctomycetota bacterium]
MIEPMVRQRVRIRFSKQGNLRFLGHHDFVRLVERLFRRAGVRAALSQGYHPKPRLAFPAALAVGIEGRDEVMEVELADSMPVDELLDRLNSQAEEGLVFHSAEWMPAGSRKARAGGMVYRIAVPPQRKASVQQKVAAILTSTSYPVLRRHKGKTVDIRPLIDDLALDGDELVMRLRIGDRGSIGPREILEELDLADLESQGAVLTRSEVELVS